MLCRYALWDKSVGESCGNRLATRVFCRDSRPWWLMMALVICGWLGPLQGIVQNWTWHSPFSTKPVQFIALWSLKRVARELGHRCCQQKQLVHLTLHKDHAPYSMHGSLYLSRCVHDCIVHKSCTLMWGSLSRRRAVANSYLQLLRAPALQLDWGSFQIACSSRIRGQSPHIVIHIALCMLWRRFSSMAVWKYLVVW